MKFAEFHVGQVIEAGVQFQHLHALVGVGAQKVGGKLAGSGA